MKKLRMIAAVLSACISGTAAAACPPMSVYSVEGMDADNLPLSEAVNSLLIGTAWKAVVANDADTLRVTFRDVSGPLDKVLDMVTRQAQKASGVGLTIRRNAVECTVNIDRSMAVIATGSGAAVAATPEVAGARTIPLETPVMPRKVDALPAGKWLDAALVDYLRENGWQLRWNIDEHYMIDVALPMPSSDVVKNVSWLVETYQLQNGMKGVRPRFTSNNVVVIEKSTATESRN